MTETTLEGGVIKILRKGTDDPDAVRFHVPDPETRWRPITWGQVLKRARCVAHWLDGEGVGAGTKVAVYATTRVEWAYVLPAIEACRAVFVPVYFSNTAAQTHYVVDHSDAEVLFTEVALLPRVLERWEDYGKVRRMVVWDLDGGGALADVLASVAEARGRDLDLDDVQARTRSLKDVYEVGEAGHQSDPERLARLVEAMDENDLAAIIYTSGTTGVPKGAMLTYRNLAATTEAWYQVLEHAFPPPGERRDILWLPISHMSGWGILGQGTLFDYETWLSDPFHLLGILPEVRPTMLFSVPAYWEKLYGMARHASSDPEAQYAELRRLTGGALSFLLSGGAGLKREVKDFFKAAGIHIIEGYGLTETAPNLTMNRLDDYDFDSVGKPVPGVTLKLAPDGEILVKGENVFPGYYKMPEETAACFDDEGWFCTGDLGEWTDRGFLKFKGRKKEIIATSGGKKIGPAGIESRFVGSPWIEHAVLYGNEKKYLVALVTGNEPALWRHAKEQGIEAGDYAELLAHPSVRGLIQGEVDAVNAELASYETIKKFYLYPGHLSVDAGHVTPSLKLRRAKVWEDFRETFEGLYG